MRPGGLELTRKLLEHAGPTIADEVDATCHNGKPVGNLLAIDIGCGTGDTLALLSKIGIEAFGIDISEKNIELASRSIGEDADTRLATGDLCDDGLEEGSFDIAIAQCTLSEISLQHGLDKTLGSCARLLAPGGMLLFSDVYDKNGTSPNLPSSREWEDALRHHGFEKIWEEDETELLADFAIAVIMAGGTVDVGNGKWCPALDGMRAEDVGYTAMVLRRSDR